MIRQTKYQDGREKMADGIRCLCNVLSLDGGILVKGSYTFSASQVAKELEGEDLYFNQGIRLAAAAIGEINSLTGCGTKETASMILSLLTLYQRKSASGENPIVLARDLRNSSERLEEAILSHAFSSTNSKVNLIRQITRADKTAQMVLEGSKEGELVVKESMYAETRLEITRGMRLDGPLSVGEPSTMTEVLVLIINRTLSSFLELYPLLETLGDRKLFLIADQIEGEALSLLTANVKQDRLHLWAMKGPGLGRRKTDIMEDAAALTGTRVFDGLYPCEIKDITMEMLGRAKTLTMTGDYTILAGDADSEEIRRRVASIQNKINAPETNYYDKQKLRERIAGLSMCAPVILAGGNTLLESREEKTRLEYAVAYAQTIEQYGICRKEDILKQKWVTETEAILAQMMNQSVKEPEISAWLLALMIRKSSSLMYLWLTTGAVMVSAGYDREDLELIKSGIDVERLRG